MLIKTLYPIYNPPQALPKKEPSEHFTFQSSTIKVHNSLFYLTGIISLTAFAIMVYIGTCTPCSPCMPYICAVILPLLFVPGMWLTGIGTINHLKQQHFIISSAPHPSITLE